MKDFFFLDLKKSLLLIGFFIICFILFFAVKFFMDMDSPFSFQLSTIVVPLYFVIAMLSSAVYILIQKREHKNFEE